MMGAVPPEGYWLAGSLVGMLWCDQTWRATKWQKRQWPSVHSSVLPCSTTAVCECASCPCLYVCTHVLYWVLCDLHMSITAYLIHYAECTAKSYVFIVWSTAISRRLCRSSEQPYQLTQGDFTQCRRSHHKLNLSYLTQLICLCEHTERIRHNTNTWTQAYCNSLIPNIL